MQRNFVQSCTNGHCKKHQKKKKMTNKHQKIIFENVTYQRNSKIYNLEKKIKNINIKDAIHYQKLYRSKHILDAQAFTFLLYSI